MFEASEDHGAGHWSLEVIARLHLYHPDEDLIYVSGNIYSSFTFKLSLDR